MDLPRSGFRCSNCGSPAVPRRKSKPTGLSWLLFVAFTFLPVLLLVNFGNVDQTALVSCLLLFGVIGLALWKATHRTWRVCRDCAFKVD